MGTLRAAASGATRHARPFTATCICSHHAGLRTRSATRVGRAATIVALLTSPAVFVLFYERYGWDPWWAALGAIGVVVLFRAIVDVLAHKLIPAPALYGADAELKGEDVISRRRHWYWPPGSSSGSSSAAVFPAP